FEINNRQLKFEKRSSERFLSAREIKKRALETQVKLARDFFPLSGALLLAPSLSARSAAPNNSDTRLPRSGAAVSRSNPHAFLRRREYARVARGTRRPMLPCTS